MYKYLSFLLSALLFCACSATDDPTPSGTYGDDVVAFGTPRITVEGTRTRAALMNAVAPNTVFGVLGYCIPYQLGTDTPDYRGGNSDWLTKKALSHADVMYREPLFYDGVKCVYSSDGVRFNEPKRWYVRERAGGVETGRFLYSFVAYHPFGALARGGGFSVSPADDRTRGVPKLSYTMPYAAGGDMDNDTLDPEASQDAMIATCFDHSASQGAVQFEFHHLLTGLRLQINNYNALNRDDPRANTVTIHSLSIKGNFYRTAEVDFSPADPVMSVGDQTFSGVFRFIGPDGEERFAPQSARVVGATPDDPQGTALLLLPKFDATADGATSAIPYLGTQKTITVEYSYEGGERVTKEIRNFSLGRMPEQGTCYTINLNFIGDQLLLMFTADAIEYWEEGSNNVIIIN